MTINFKSSTIFWQGPAPFIFIPIPRNKSKTIKDLSKTLTYGWGCIPIFAQIGKSKWKTSLIPKNWLYLVPIKNAIRDSEKIKLNKRYNVKIDFIVPAHV